MPRDNLFVRRPVSSHDHKQLHDQIPEVNSQLPEYASVKWRNLGLASLTLLDRGEYIRAVSKSHGQLSQLPADEIADIVKYGLSAKGTGTAQIEASVEGVGFIGSGTWKHIAMAIDSPQVMTERDELIMILDELNSVNSQWRDFEPYVSLATVEAIHANEDVLKPFKAILPKVITLNPIQVSLT